MLKKILLACTGLLLLQLTACRCTNANVIYDVNSGEKVYIETESSGWIELVAFVDKDKKVFKTLQRLGGNSKQKERSLRLKTYDITGKKLAQQILPFDFEYWLKNEYSFSPDGKEIVYFNRASTSLNLYNIATSKDELIVPNISKIGVSIEKIIFINADKFVVFLSDDEDVGRTTDQILSCNVRFKTYGLLHESNELFDLMDKFVISKNRKTIAFPKENLRDSVLLMNTTDSDLKTVKFLNSGDVQYLAFKGDDVLAVANEYINIYNLKTGKTETVFQMKKDFIVSYLFFIGNDKIFSAGWMRKGDSNDKECYLIDINKKELIKKFSISGNEWKQLDDHTLIYEALCWFWF